MLQIFSTTVNDATQIVTQHIDGGVAYYGHGCVLTMLGEQDEQEWHLGDKHLGTYCASTELLTHSDGTTERIVFDEDAFEQYATALLQTLQTA